MHIRDAVPPALLAGIIILLAYFGGGKAAAMGPAFFALFALYLILAQRFLGRRTATNELVILGLFFLWIVVDTVFFSRRQYASLVTLLPLVSGALLYVALITSAWSERFREIFFKTLAAGAVAITLISVAWYLPPQFTSLRMAGTFFQHNAFAGFLIIPLLVSIYFAITSRPNALVYAAGAVVLAAGLVLTFSRGGLISAGAALVLFLAALFWSLPLRDAAGKAALVLALLMLGAALGYGLYELKTAYVVVAEGQAPLGPFAGERPDEGETGVAARFEYWKHAVLIFREFPLGGTGLGAFGQEALRVQSDPRFFSADPHNLYLKMFAELGIIGGILFAAFVALALIKKGVSILRRREDLLTASLYAGFVGLLIHYGGDIDFTFPAHVLLFFGSAAFLAEQGEGHFGGVRLYNTLLLVTFLFLLIISASFGSWYYAGKAGRAFEEGDIVAYDENYKRARALDPVSPHLSFSRTRVLFEANQHERALENVEQALRMHPHERSYRILRGDIYNEVERVEEAEADFRAAIDLAPFRDLEPDTRLVSLLHGEDRVAEARAVAERALGRFPPVIFESSIWAHPDRLRMSFQAALLRAYLNSNP